MSLGKKQRQKYIDRFYDPQLTENEFIGLLLPYMRKNGIIIISEQELSKKLYPYFKDEKYREVFMEFAKDRYREQVNISYGISTKKYFSRNIMWTSNNPNSLHLLYGDDYDTSYIENNINVELINLIKGIANDLGIRNKFETADLNIYGENPNKDYSIIYAKENMREIYESRLITDGDILNISDHGFEPNLCYPDPTGRTEARHYRDCINRFVSLKNASYAIVQGILNDELKKVRCFQK